MIKHPYNVLIIDDEADICELIDSMINKQFPGILNTIKTTSGNEAMKIIEQKEIHIVITDFLMPDRLGFDIIKQIKDKNNWVQSIVMTGTEELVTPLACFKDGASLFMKKPFKKTDFHKRLNNIVERLELWVETFSSYKK